MKGNFEEEVKTRFGKNLRRIMKERGIDNSQKLSSLTGISSSTIRDYLNESSQPTITNFLVIMKVLKVPFNEFFRKVD